MRRIVLSVSLLVIVAVSGCTATGEVVSDSGGVIGDAYRFVRTLFFSPVPQPPGDTIKIVTWNIENFGKTKAGNETIMDKIADVISAYDIVAIQEVSNIREQSDPGCPRNEDSCPGDPSCGVIREALESSLNERLGLNYSFLFSPQVKDERYLFVWNPEKASLLDSGLMDDPTERGNPCDLSPENVGLMIRQPFYGVFRAGDFDFLLLTAHTSPGINSIELDGLDYFFREATRKGEPDVILLGDLNADCSYLSDEAHPDLMGPGYVWPVPSDADTTSGPSDCAYDRFVFRQDYTGSDYAGSWGVERDVTPDISDHYPVWLEFYTDRDGD
jgi:deoxyribonuclease-1-like protein